MYFTQIIYIGKRYGLNYGDWDTAKLNIKDFKIYNNALNIQEVFNCMNNNILDLPYYLV